jgi:hypothetical protein
MMSLNSGSFCVRNRTSFGAHLVLYKTNPSSFNQKLIPWLVWYNTERPHWGLHLKSPMQFMLGNIIESV